MEASTPEEKARIDIDQQLTAAGWTVQSISELNLYTGRGIAVREVQSKGGPADYMLFVEGKALGVVEAKKAGTTLSAVAEQSARYGKAQQFVPYAEIVDQRFAVWLDEQADANDEQPFDTVHLEWLCMIKDHIASSAAIEPDDFEDVPFNQKGGLAKARKLFGNDFNSILEDLNTALVG